MQEYETELKIRPRRFNSLYGAGQAAEMMKDPEKASSYYRQLMEICSNADSERPELTHAREFISTLAAK